MNISAVKVRTLLLIVLGFLAAMGTIANGLLFLTVWEQYQNNESSIALYKVIGSVALGGISSVVVVMMILIVFKTLSVPLRELTKTMVDLSNQNLEIAIPYHTQKNEFGDMARTLEMFRDKLKENHNLHKNQLMEERKRGERTRALETAIQEFNQDVSHFVEELRTSMEGLMETAIHLAEIAREGLVCAEDLQLTSDQATQNTKSIYESAQDMLSSITKVSEQVSQSGTISGQAAMKAKDASETIATLQEAADQIGGVITLINDIAGETNMLALNATIEAARAGESGKSFAVVAGEVKNLATQTAEATGEIGEQVEDVKLSVLQTVSKIGEIEGVIKQMNDVLQTVTESMHTQNQASTMIADNSQSAVTSSQRVQNTSGSVFTSAQKTQEFSEKLRVSSEELLSKTDFLCQSMQRFFDRIKA